MEEVLGTLSTATPPKRKSYTTTILRLFQIAWKERDWELRETVLVTGGAGFIGRAVTKELLGRGNTVRALDNLIEQVHGDRERPDDFPKDAELIVGDIRNRDVVARALQGVDSVIHLAAEVGVGQSMYAVERYTSVNETGSAVLFEALIDHPVLPRRHCVVDEHLWGRSVPGCRRRCCAGCHARRAV